MCTKICWSVHVQLHIRHSSLDVNYVELDGTAVCSIVGLKETRADVMITEEVISSVMGNCRLDLFKLSSSKLH